MKNRKTVWFSGFIRLGNLCPTLFLDEISDDGNGDILTFIGFVRPKNGNHKESNRSESKCNG